MRLDAKRRSEAPRGVIASRIVRQLSPSALVSRFILPPGNANFTDGRG